MAHPSAGLPNKSLIPASWEVPAEFRVRVGEKAGRQRAMLAEDHLLLVLHRPPQANEPERIGRLFWRKPDGTWQSNELGGGVASLRQHISQYAAIVDRHDRLEDAASDISQFYEILDALGPLQRSVRHLHATLQEGRKAVPDDRDLINLRDQAYDLERTCELLYNDLQNAMEFAIAKQSEQQAIAAHEMAIASHRLNLLVAFFFPIATLTTIFGTSLQHGLEEMIPPPYAFYSVIGLGLFLGLILMTFLSKRWRKATAARRSEKAASK